MNEDKPIGRVRAKFVVACHQSFPAQPGAAHTIVKLSAAISGDKNGDWSKWTPSGEIEMTVTNPAAVEAFELGRPFYVDFTPAEKED